MADILLQALGKRLQFARFFHKEGTKPFLEIMRQIEKGEEPYVDTRDPESTDDEPAFYSEWEDADVARDLAGMACLSVIQGALQSYISEYLNDFFGKVDKDGRDFFARNQKVFKDAFGIEWQDSSADLALIREMILVRNDSQHNTSILRSIFTASRKTERQFPKPRFRHKGWIHLVAIRLVVYEENIEQAIAAVEGLSGYLSSLRSELRTRLRAGYELPDGFEHRSKLSFLDKAGDLDDWGEEAS